MARQLVRCHAVLGSDRIAAYVACDGEIDTADALARLRASNKRCYLPVLARGNRLTFAPLNSRTRLARNRLGVPEPRVPRSALLGARHLDVLLVPLVGFDRRANRLGMGGGFYDRTLAFLAWRGRWRKPRLIGVAHDLQRTDGLAQAPWDVTLDMVVTDAGVYRAGGHEA